MSQCKHGNRILWLASWFAAFGLSGCRIEDDGAVENSTQLLESNSGIDTEFLGEKGTEDARETPPIVAEWILGHSTEKRASNKPVLLRLTNYSQMDVSFSTSIELLGLRRMRRDSVSELGVLKVGESRLFEWAPDRSPLQPIGSSVEAAIKVQWSVQAPVDDERREVVGGELSSEHMYVSYSDDYRQVFLSHDDDLSVRLESLRTTSFREQVHASQPKRTQLAAILSARESPRGKIDGKMASESQILSIVGASNAYSDSLPLSPEWEEALLSPLEKDAPMSARYGTTEASVAAARECMNAGRKIVYKNVCVMLRTAGMYNDSNVTSASIPTEDHLLNDRRAAYVKASVISYGIKTWTANLDWAGCTGWEDGPGVPLCVHPTSGQIYDQVELDTGHIWREEGGDGPSLAIGVYPQRFYLSSGWTQDGSFAHTLIGTQDRFTRAAAVASRALTVSDMAMTSSSRGIVMRVDRGWARYSDPNGYASAEELAQPYGEASASSSLAYSSMLQRESYTVNFGRTAKFIGVNGSQPQYEALPLHTTQSKFTIAHELGHVVQFHNAAFPKTDNYTSQITSGMCSCEFVTSGNNVHCLGSRHLFGTSNGEGFGHFFAARIMNDVGPGAGCRFSYYKTNVFGQVMFQGQPVGYWTMSPPVPIDCSVPYSSSSSSTTGWMRSHCPSPSSYGTERDWLTFLWALNAKSVGSGRLSMMDLMWLFAQSHYGNSYMTWSNMFARAQGLNATQRQRIDQEGEAHGMR